MFTGNGRQSIAAVLAALVPTGGRCGIEAITYPFAKGVATQLGITLVPLAMDEHGVRPDAVQKAHREGKLSAIYVQPVIHNPLGMTMPQQRRAELLRVAEKLDLVVIEDSIYGFLDEVPPLASLAPERCVVIDSLSKRIAPGLSLGFIAAPQRLREAIMAAVRTGGWIAPGYAFAAAERLMSDGTAAEITTLKRTDAKQRQVVAVEMLKGLQRADQPEILSPVAGAARAVALADIRRRRSPPRHRAHTVERLRRQPRPRPERHPPGAGAAAARPAARGAGTLAHILKGSDEDGYFTE